MNESDAIEEEISARLAEAMDLDLEATALGSEMSLRDDLGLDSLQSVNLILDLENAFDIEIYDEETEALATVGDIVALVKKKKGL